MCARLRTENASRKEPHPPPRVGSHIPQVFLPQHLSEPLSSTAHEWWVPHPMRVADPYVPRSTSARPSPMSDDNRPLAVWFPNPSCPKGCQKGGISEMPFVILFLPYHCGFQARQRMAEHLILGAYPLYRDINLIVPRNHHTIDFRTVSMSKLFVIWSRI